MQNSELYRRGVIAPRDTGGLLAIRSSDVTESTPVTAALLEGEDEFEWLSTRNFFGRINTLTGTTLNDFEEDEVEAGQVGQVLIVVLQFQAMPKVPPAVRIFLRDLATVCATAQRYGMPLFFIL